MLQILYVSSSNRRASTIDIPALLEISQRNNHRDGITGLLYTDARRFLQVLEGDAAKVEATFSRISADIRHHAIVLLSRREITTKEFGAWSMALRDPSDSHDAFANRLEELTSNASPAVRGTFAGLLEARRAA